MQIAQKTSVEIKSLIFSFLIITICQFFFLIDIYADFFRIDIDTSWFDHDQIELFAVISLTFAMVVIGKQIWQLLRENSKFKDSIQVASGELLTVIYYHFAGWKLSPSEIEVALMLIKGFSTQEIANLRNTKMGTVKSQTSSIYRKANISGRNELVAYFVEDLLGEKYLEK